MSIQRDIDAELRFHLETRIEELVSQGMTPEAARAQAVAEFGDVERTRAGLNEIDRRVAKRRGRVELIGGVWQDLRYATRSLRRTPVVAVTIILTLALGLGANAAMFSLLDTIYLRPPAGVVRPDQIRRVWVERHFRSGDTRYWAGFDYAAYTALDRAFEQRVGITLYDTPLRFRIGRGENAPIARVSGTQARYFSLLGVKPALGRFYDEQEAGLTTMQPVAVISDVFWKRHFSGAANVIGQQLSIASKKFTVIGVAARGFRGIDLDATDVWLPIGSTETGQGDEAAWWRNPNVNGFQIVIRLNEAVAEQELVHRATQTMRLPNTRYGQDTLAVAAFGAINRERGPGKVSAEMQVAKRLAGVSILVLIIACANVVNLLLARAVQRKREIAVRLALGVSRARLIRLLVLESALLGVVASVAAMVAAKMGGALLRALLMPRIEWAESVLHWRVLAFAIGAAVIAGALAGLVPALQMSSPQLTDGLKAGVREGGGHRSRLRTALVMTQTALSVVLLVGATLFVRSLYNVKTHDIGYSVDQLGFAEASYEVRDSIRDAAYPARLRALEPRIAAIPGVEAVAFTSLRPVYGISTTRYYPDADTTKLKKPEGFFTVVSPGFFATTGTKLLRGRSFPENAGATAPFTVVVNEAMAKALWPNEDPIGRCIRFENANAPCATVIGVVQTAMLMSIREEPSPHFYVSLDRPPLRARPAAAVIVRAAPGRLPAAQRAIRELMREAFPGAIPYLTTMADTMAPEYRPWDLGAKLFTLFGVLALVVAAIGVYSTVSYSVNRRTREFGVRIALGARAADVLRHVLVEGLRVSVVGTAVGVALALAAGKLVSSLLYGIAPSDPVSLTIVSAVLISIALVAALVPARRASRADPMTALRAD